MVLTDTDDDWVVQIKPGLAYPELCRGSFRRGEGRKRQESSITNH